MVLLLLAPLALADVPDEDRWVASDHLALGLAVDGSLINGALPLGLLWDPDGPAGDEPLSGDWLLAGNAFETWSATWSGGEAVNGAPYLGSDVVLDWEPVGVSEAMTWMEGWGDTGDLEVLASVQLPWGEDHAWLELRITALADLDDLWVARSIDPDPDAALLGSYGTANVAGDGWATATSAWDGRTLALAADRAEARLCAWCARPAEVLAGSPGEASGDHQLGLAVEVGDVAAGEEVVIVFAYAMGWDVAEASDLALMALAEDDRDADGFGLDEDCDDRDPSVGPGLPEWADGLDNDCDGTVDEDTWISDDDGDHWTEEDGDCDDTDPYVHPGAAPYEGVVDADCDGIADAGDWPPEGQEVWVEWEEDVGGCAAPVGGLLLWSPLVLLAMRRRS